MRRHTLDPNDITKDMRVRADTFNKEAPSTFAICGYSSLRKDLIVAGILFSIANYCYYGSIFGLEALKGNIYFNSVFSAVADLIGYLFIDTSL